MEVTQKQVCRTSKVCAHSTGQERDGPKGYRQGFVHSSPFYFLHFCVVFFSFEASKTHNSLTFLRSRLIFSVQNKTSSKLLNYCDWGFLATGKQKNNSHWSFSAEATNAVSSLKPKDGLPTFDRVSSSAYARWRSSFS